LEIRQRLDLFNDAPEKPVKNSQTLLDDTDYRTVWDLMGYDPKPMDVIIEQSGLSAREISSMLLMMELKGMVIKHSNGRYVRA
jgi:DNA processing protein